MHSKSSAPADFAQLRGLWTPEMNAEHSIFFDSEGNEFAAGTPPNDPLLTLPESRELNDLTLAELPSITQFRGTAILNPIRDRDTSEPIECMDLCKTVMRTDRIHQNEVQTSCYTRLFICKRVPQNTLRSSKNGLRLLAQFVLALINDPKCDEQYFRLATIASKPQNA